MRYLFTLPPLLLVTDPALAHETSGVASSVLPPPATMSRSAWWQGTWRGAVMDSQATEVASTPTAGQTAGRFAQAEGEIAVRHCRALHQEPSR